MIAKPDAGEPSALPSEGVRTPSFFFLVGCPRSGTTLLRWMLDAHPAIAVTPETHFGQHYLSRPPRLPQRPRSHARRDDPGHTPGAEASPSSRSLDHFCASPAFKELAIDEATFRKRVVLLRGEPWGPLRVAMEDFARLRNVSIVGEKTPSHALQLEALAEAFPEARFLILKRDPRAVAASWHRASWSHHSTTEIAETWSRSVRATDRARQRLGPRCLELSYEDLAAQPKDVLGRICEFLGTGFDARTLHYHERPADTMSPEQRRDHARTFEVPDPARIDAWRSELPDRDLRQIEALCARPMTRSGYSLETSIRARLPDMLKSLPSSWRKRIKRRLRRRA